MDFELTGSQSERVLEAFGGGKSRSVTVHLCPEGCGQLDTGANHFHARGYYDTRVAPKEWQQNLIPAKVDRGVEPEVMSWHR